MGTEGERRMSAGQKRRKKLRQNILIGRMAMLVALGVSLINQLLLLLKVNYHFLFSASMPYYLNWLARELGSTGFKIFAALLTMLIYGAYVACWLFSMQKREWMLAGLGLYAADTLALLIFSFALLSNPWSCFFEILIHLVCLWLLFVAYRSAEMLSRMPKRRRPAPEPKPELETIDV